MSAPIMKSSLRFSTFLTYSVSLDCFACSIGAEPLSSAVLSVLLSLTLSVFCSLLLSSFLEQAVEASIIAARENAASLLSISFISHLP